MPIELQNKHILVDTNILSNIFYNPDLFQDFLTALTDLSCALAVNDYIKIELLRIAGRKTLKDNINSFLSSSFINLPTSPDIHAITNDLYPLYNYCSSIKNAKQVSVVDAINVAFMKKYNSNLYFITLDNNDFPLEILDRIATGTIDMQKQILTWGIYRFNDVHYQALLNRFNDN